MRFSSSKEETRKGTYLTWSFHRGKGFGIKYFQRIVRAWKRIQNLPWKRCRNVIAQNVHWEKIDPIQKRGKNLGVTTHCHLK
jgi:hypothetical protein